MEAGLDHDQLVKVSISLVQTFFFYIAFHSMQEFDVPQLMLLEMEVWSLVLSTTMELPITLVHKTITWLVTLNALVIKMETGQDLNLFVYLLNLMMVGQAS